MWPRRERRSFRGIYPRHVAVRDYPMNKSKKKVLIVDDKPEMCEILRDGFVDCLQDIDCPYEFEVEVAASTVECVKRIRGNGSRRSYDVIVLDVRMEGER